MAAETKVVPGARWEDLDPLDALRRTVEMQAALDRLRTAAVQDSRAAGCSWASIAGALGVSTQSAWERFRDA